jgi:hypothetical protein
MTGSPARQRALSTAGAVAGGILAFAFLIAQIAVWSHFAGQAGSPRPDDWDAMERVIGVVESAMLPSMALLALNLLTWGAARKGLSWVWLHPLAVVVAASVELVLCVHTWTHPPPVAVPDGPGEFWPGHPRRPAANVGPPILCWPRGKSPLPSDVGTYQLNIGDLATIQSIPGVYASIAKDPAEAAQISSLLGKTVRITGFSPEGGIWFAPIGAASSAAAPADPPKICLRPSDLVRVRTHG